MVRITMMGMGGDRSEWGWARMGMDRIARMVTGLDGQYFPGWKGLSGWGWTRMGKGLDGQYCLDGCTWKGLPGW